MKQRIPSFKTISFCVFASAMALLSLPTGQYTNSYFSPLSHVTHTEGAVATVGNATDSNSDSSPVQKPTPHQGTHPKLNQGNSTAPKSGQGQPGAQTNPSTDSNTPPSQAKMGRLRIRVIDGRTYAPLSGAEVVLIETEKRYVTGKDGFTPWFNAPIIRHPKYRPMVAELHGQLGCIAYKNGYRDSIHIGIRMHEGIPSETTVWMYKIGPGDRRVEPVLYQVPYHRIWLIELADKFRSKSQIGEGPERP